MSDAKPRIRIVSAEIRRDGQYLITQRPDHAVLPGLWEFPGGRVRRGESDAEALARCLRKRLGVAVEVGAQVLEVPHSYPHYELVLAVYSCAPQDEPVAGSVADIAWVLPDELADYPFPDADQATVEKILRNDDMTDLEGPPIVR